MLSILINIVLPFLLSTTFYRLTKIQNSTLIVFEEKKCLLPHIVNASNLDYVEALQELDHLATTAFISLRSDILDQGHFSNDFPEIHILEAFAKSTILLILEAKDFFKPIGTTTANLFQMYLSNLQSVVDVGASPTNVVDSLETLETYLQDLSGLFQKFKATLSNAARGASALEARLHKFLADEFQDLKKIRKAHLLDLLFLGNLSRVSYFSKDIFEPANVITHVGVELGHTWNTLVQAQLSSRWDHFNPSEHAEFKVNASKLMTLVVQFEETIGDLLLLVQRALKEIRDGCVLNERLDGDSANSSIAGLAGVSARAKITLKSWDFDGE
jgi:hypothetical protein